MPLALALLLLVNDFHRCYSSGSICIHCCHPPLNRPLDGEGNGNMNNEVKWWWWQCRQWHSSLPCHHLHIKPLIIPVIFQFRQYDQISIHGSEGIGGNVIMLSEHCQYNHFFLKRSMVGCAWCPSAKVRCSMGDVEFIRED